jgi:hypothetical protein
MYLKRRRAVVTFSCKEVLIDLVHFNLHTYLCISIIEVN